MNSRLASGTECFPVLARLVSRRTHDLRAKPQSKTNYLCLFHLMHGLTRFDVVSVEARQQSSGASSFSLKAAARAEDLDLIDDHDPRSVTYFLVRDG